MEELDRLVFERLVPFRARLVDGFKAKHSHLFGIINTVLGERENKVAMQVTEGGKVAGTYTFYLKGVNIVDTASGKLESEIHHPFLGILKPYVIVERTTIEKMLTDETGFVEDLFPTMARYLPELTIKFLH